jgi:UPF0755 protein
MSDDLGLGLSEGDGAASYGRPPSYGRRRVVVALVALAVIAIIVVAVLGGARFFDRLFGAPADYSGDGTGTATVQITPGQTLSDIGDVLVDAGVVKSVEAFTDAASENEDASSIGPGYYALHKHMSAAAAVELLLDPSSLQQARVVVPEGRRMRDIFAAIADATDITVPQLEKVAENPAALGVPSWGAGHPLEGFLFPATYDFPPGTTAKEALTAMVRRFDQAATDAGLVKGARRVGLSPYEVLTIASIIEREGRLVEDFAKIAEVFYNRLDQGMRLDSDATLYYVLEPDHGGLTNSDLAIDSPYNTRLNPGIPPTPIASPGDNALNAALHPAEGPYLYFVTIDKEGHAAFAETLDEFNDLVAQSRANGVE